MGNKRQDEVRKDTRDHVPDSFTSPEQLPKDQDEAQDWQASNRSFWESLPMRYDWNEEVEHEEFSKPFFEEIDRRFYSAVREFMPWKKLPFDTLIDFEELASQDVLEIGVGMGSHAQLLAAHAGSYTGIDLTERAINTTQKRLDLFGIEANLQRMDAEQLSFEDKQFDLVWSWGVIHHSSNTKKILEQIHRVLKPGGKAIIMVYYRGWWNYYIVGGILGGLARGKLLQTRSISKSIQNQTDGALARYYNLGSWRELVKDHFVVEYAIVKGPKTDIIAIPAGATKNTIMRATPSVLTRLMTNRLGMGGFLISKIKKRQKP